MGLDIGGDSRPKITKTEMEKKVKPELYHSGMSAKERARLEASLQPSLEGKNSFQKGIDKDELERTISALENTPDQFKIMSKEKLERAEKILRKNL